MRRDRDTFLLLTSFIPIGIVLYTFYSFRTTGTWPFTASILAVPLPSTAVPAFLRPFDTIPDPIKGWIMSGQANWQIVLPGVIAGGIAGFLVIGVVADIIRVALARISRFWAARRATPIVDDSAMGDPVITL